MKDPEVPEPEALDNGGPALPGLVEPRKHRAHDFQKPRLLPEREVRALDTLHRKFARSLSSSLSVLARVKVQVDLSSVAQRSYFEFLRSLLSPTSLHLIYCFPGRIPFVAELSPTVLFPMIERLLGGKGEDPSTNSRPLTKIEQSLASSILSRLLEDLREAWAACPGLRFDCAETEHNPLLMQIVGPTEPSVIFCFQVSVGAKTGALHLAFPSKLFAALSRSVVCSYPGEARSIGHTRPSSREKQRGRKAKNLETAREHAAHGLGRARFGAHPASGCIGPEGWRRY